MGIKVENTVNPRIRPRGLIYKNEFLGWGLFEGGGGAYSRGGLFERGGLFGNLQYWSREKPSKGEISSCQPTFIDDKLVIEPDQP